MDRFVKITLLSLKTFKYFNGRDFIVYETIYYDQVSWVLVLPSLTYYYAYTCNLLRLWSTVTLIKNRPKIGFPLKTLSAVILSERSFPAVRK